MSTRSLTIFKDDDGQEIVVMYHHYDGYLKGYGKELAEFLKGMVLTTGIPTPEKCPEKFANGMHCLAAQVVAKFKDRIGDTYLWPAGKRHLGEDYIYEVAGNGPEEVSITAIKCYGEKEILFSGPASEILDRINNMR